MKKIIYSILACTLLGSVILCVRADLNDSSGEIEIIVRGTGDFKNVLLKHGDRNLLLDTVSYVHPGMDGMSFITRERYRALYVEDSKSISISDERGLVVGVFLVEESGALKGLGMDEMFRLFRYPANEAEWGSLIARDFDHDDEMGGRLTGTALASPSDGNLLVHAKNSRTNISRLYIYEEAKVRFLYIHEEGMDQRIIVFDDREQVLGSFGRQAKGEIQRISIRSFSDHSTIWAPNW